MRRYFIGLLLAIGLIILVIVLIVSSGGKPAVPSTSAPLESYATSDATAQMTIIGPTVAPQNHSEVQINIGENQTTYTQYQGYDGSVVSTKAFPNTEASYNAFLHALDHAGFTMGTATSTLKDDSGYCSTGDRYIFEFMQNGKDLERYWITNCSGTPKTFTGDFSLNVTLFEAQVPGYGNLNQNANF